MSRQQRNRSGLSCATVSPASAASSQLLRFLLCSFHILCWLHTAPSSLFRQDAIITRFLFGREEVDEKAFPLSPASVHHAASPLPSLFQGRQSLCGGAVHGRSPQKNPDPPLQGVLRQCGPGMNQTLPKHVSGRGRGTAGWGEASC